MSGNQFDQLPTAMAALPMTQNSNTGTYYHQQFDLSVKRVGVGADGYCSIVFGTTEAVNTALIAFAAGVAAIAPNDDSNVTVNSPQQALNRTYLNLTTNPK